MAEQQGKRVILWGLGGDYQRYRASVLGMAAARGMQVVGVVSAQKDAETYDGFQWMDKRELTPQTADWVIVMTSQYFVEILGEAVALGFRKEQVVNVALLVSSDFAFDEAVEVGSFIVDYMERQHTEDTPGLFYMFQSYGFAWPEYKAAVLSLKEYREDSIVLSGGADDLSKETERLEAEMRKRRVSFVSMNCSAGILYHSLGMQFLSPTINMWEQECDYLKLAADFPRYLKYTLQLSAIAWHEAGRNAYPLFQLGDIAIHMNHYTDIMQAAQKWYERRERVNFDDMVALSYTDNPMFLRRFEELPFEQKVCFVPFETSSPSAFCIDRSKTNHRTMWWVSNDICQKCEPRLYAKLLKRLMDMKE